MRVIAGTYKGRRLKAPTWEGLRPTSDKLRETLFNVLAARIEGARVLDGFAGTGALGIEALSRGAFEVTFIEHDRLAQALIADNLANCGIERGYTVVGTRVARGFEALRSAPSFVPFDIVLLDPPYDAQPHEILAGAASLVVPGGMVALEHARTREVPARAGRLALVRHVRSGDSSLSLYEMATTFAVYPGSFDPLTNGHVDIITRGARLFDKVVVAMLQNLEKAPLFSIAERVDIARAVFGNLPNVEVDTFDGLLVDYVERRGAQVIVRGLRAVSDFESELQMALMNQRLNGRIETVFMMPAEQYSYISSRLIKEVFALGGRVRGLVPDIVEQRLRDKLSGVARK